MTTAATVIQWVRFTPQPGHRYPRHYQWRLREEAVTEFSDYPLVWVTGACSGAVIVDPQNDQFEYKEQKTHRMTDVRAR